MVETHWEDIRGKTVRYRDHTWELTGDVDVRESGALLVVEAKQVDDVQGEKARLYFDLSTSGDSLNPGNLGEHFDSLKRTRNKQYLLIKKAPKTYRYELQRLEYK